MRKSLSTLKTCVIWVAGLFVGGVIFFVALILTAVVYLVGKHHG